MTRTSGFSLIGRETILVSFCEDEISFVFVEAPTNFRYNSLEAAGCSGEDVLAVKFSQRDS